MNKFPVLEQLEELKLKKFVDFTDEYYLIAVQHLLSTTGSLFEAIISFGFRSDHIFLTGKIYSTHEPTKTKLKELGINIYDSTYPKKPGTYSDCLENDVKCMWNILRNVIVPNGKIIILDDGGYMLRNIPDDMLKSHKIVGIEQTTSGTRMQPAFEKIPVISVATSSIKLTQEPPIVAESVKLKLGGIIRDLNPKSVGIAGYGHVGKAVAEMISLNYPVYVYDPNSKVTEIMQSRIVLCKSLNELYNSSDIIIGATGEDISSIQWLTESVSDKTLISISSGDIEFNKILKASEPYMIEPYIDPLKTLQLKTARGHMIRILRGGLVANFTGEANSGPPERIQITRALLLKAILQAQSMFEEGYSLKGIITLA